MTSSFFNANLVGDSYDRTYTATDFANYFKQFIGNGVYANPSTSMKVVANSGLMLQISAGTCFINGYTGYSDGTDFITLDTADYTYSRYDRVVARLSLTDRKIDITVIKGTASATPTAPSLIRTSTIYDICLATVSVITNATSITQERITDTRFDSSLCGIVTGVIDTIDTTDLFAQYQAAWDLLIAGLGGDEADVIAAFNAINTTKSVNGKKPVNGNIPLVQGDIPSGNGAYKVDYVAQYGTISISADTTITFAKAFKTPPVVVCTPVGTTGSSGYYMKIIVLSKTGFTAQSYTYDKLTAFNWIAIGEV